LSRHHAILHLRPPRVLLIDLDSTNGTYVNEHRTHHVELSDGDEIGLGQSRVRVGIRMGEGDAPPPVEVCCAGCQQPLPECSGALGEVGRGLLCPSCVAAAATRPAAPVEGEMAPSWRCVDCDRDLSAVADADGRATELAGSLYLCGACAEACDAPGSGNQIGPYRVLGEIGRGGMGVVFKALHVPTCRLCAVKQILPEAARDEHAVRLFEREIAVQSTVIHPNLVRVLGRGRLASTCYVVFEYLAGGDLRRLVGRPSRGALDPALAVRIAGQILAGLEALHDRGFVHRDLKPANVLVDRPVERGRVTAKVSDYGLAKSFEEAGNTLFDLTREGEAAGSLLFMPPEQILDYRFVGPQVDVYAAGVTLYYLLTGRHTVDVPSPALRLARAAAGGPRRSLVSVVLDDPPIPLLERKPALPADFAAVVDRAVDKDPARRYRTAAEFRHQLLRAGRRGGLV
jgi:serine/threonine-protein kinase